MACCLIAALFVLVVRRLTPWRKHSDDGGFAPAAVWSAPGVAPTELAPPVVPWLDDRSATAARVARAVAVSVAIYLVATALLVRFGIAMDTGSMVRWWVRSLLLAALAGALLVWSARVRRRGCDPLSTVRTVGLSGLAAGLTVLFAVSVDMHLLHVFHIHDPGVHTAVHVGAGLIALTGVLVTALDQAGIGRRDRVVA